MPDIVMVAVDAAVVVGAMVVGAMVVGAMVVGAMVVGAAAAVVSAEPSEPHAASRPTAARTSKLLLT